MKLIATKMAMAVATGVGTIVLFWSAPVSAKADEPPSSCGDSIQLQITSFKSDVMSFKLVGVDLGQYLGSGNGIMSYGAGVLLQSVQKSGNVNASGSGGARTGIITINIATSQDYDIQASIQKSVGGQQLCSNVFIGNP
jgi:hypothetical protein